MAEIKPPDIGVVKSNGTVSSKPAHINFNVSPDVLIFSEPNMPFPEVKNARLALNGSNTAQPVQCIAWSTTQGFPLASIVTLELLNILVHDEPPLSLTKISSPHTVLPVDFHNCPFQSPVLVTTIR